MTLPTSSGCRFEEMDLWTLIKTDVELHNAVLYNSTVSEICFSALMIMGAVGVIFMFVLWRCKL